MTDATREPPVPADANLQDFPYTPVFRARLFGSSFHARSTDAEWRAGFTLWLKSWDQVPAGSLPNDDIELCRLAELGRDLKNWKKIKNGALHGWFQCTDGLLYHDVVSEGVLEALGKRRTNSKKGKAGAEARWGKTNGSGNATTKKQNAPANGTAINKNASAIAGAMPNDGNRSEVEGKGIEVKHSGEDASSTARELEKAPPLAPDESGNPKQSPLAAHLIGQGVQIDAKDPRIAGWEARGFTIGGIEHAVTTARTRKGRATGPIPANLIALIIDDQLEQSVASEETRVDPQCTEILADDTRCREGAIFYPGRSKKGVCREHHE